MANGRAAQGLQRLLSRIILGSAHHAWAVIGVVALLTVASVAVLVTVEPNVETDIQAGYFGTSDAQANAFRELRSKVAGVNSEIVYFELRDNARGLNPSSGEVEPVDNVTDVPALLAQEELFRFVKNEFAVRSGHDKVLSDTSLPYFFRLIYAQFPHGGYEIPTNPIDHQLAAQLVISAGGPSINLYHSDNRSKAPEAAWDAAVMFIIYDPDTTHLPKKETGGLINEIIEDYRGLAVGDCGLSGVCKTYDLWEPAYLDSWGVQSWIYRIDEQVNKEAAIFTGAVFLFLTLVLLVLLRSVKRTIIGVSTLAIILLWTLAGMTAGGVSVGFISMAMFPLILGVGVDYVIHIMNEFGAERGGAASSDAAFEAIGRRGAVALLLATLTTLSGFTIMIFSTSPMIVEICVATLLGILGTYLLAITFIPAMLHLTVRDDATEVFHPSRLTGGLAEFLGRRKAVGILLLLVGTVALASQIPRVEYVIGTVEVNLPSKELWTHRPERAHMLDMYERFQTQIKATGQETVITRGDGGPGSLATKAAVDDMIAIHKAMVADPFVQDAGGAVNSVPFILNLYAILQDGRPRDRPGHGVPLPAPAAPAGPAAAGVRPGNERGLRPDVLAHRGLDRRRRAGRVRRHAGPPRVRPAAAHVHGRGGQHRLGPHLRQHPHRPGSHGEGRRLLPRRARPGASRGHREPLLRHPDGHQEVQRLHRLLAHDEQPGQLRRHRPARRRLHPLLARRRRGGHAHGGHVHLVARRPPASRHPDRLRVPHPGGVHHQHGQRLRRPPRMGRASRRGPQDAVADDGQGGRLLGLHHAGLVLHVQPRGHPRLVRDVRRLRGRHRHHHRDHLPCRPAVPPVGRRKDQPLN
jgi:hypothetical protein